jgi:hypothetical protein
MKTFLACASYVTYCYAYVEADSEDEAFEIAKDLDGGAFHGEDPHSGDWTIDSVTEHLT